MSELLPYFSELRKLRKILSSPLEGSEENMCLHFHVSRQGSLSPLMYFPTRSLDGSSLIERSFNALMNNTCFHGLFRSQ